MTETLERTQTNEHAGHGVFTTTRATLAHALDTVGVAIASRPSVPVLAGVLLESHGPDLLVTGFDYDTTITVTIPNAVEVPGRLLVPHRELSKLLKALTTGMGKRAADRLAVILAARDVSFATVTLADSTMPLPLLPLEEYPSLPELPPAFAHVDGEVFASEVTRVLPAVGRDDVMPMLTGVKLDATSAGDGLMVAASDRYRLAVAHLQVNTGTNTAPTDGVLIEAAMLGKILPRLDGDLSIGCGPGPFGELVSLVSGPISVITRLHNNNEFLSKDTEYTTFLPTSAATTVVVDRVELVTQLQRAAGVMKAKGHTDRATALTVDMGSVRVMPHLPEGSHHVSTPKIPATVTGHTDIPFGLNTRYVIDALASTFTGSKVTLHLQSPTKPFVVTDTPEGLNDPHAFRHLLMPVRLA